MSKFNHSFSINFSFLSESSKLEDVDEQEILQAIRIYMEYMEEAPWVVKDSIEDIHDTYEVK